MVFDAGNLIFFSFFRVIGESNSLVVNYFGCERMYAGVFRFCSLFFVSLIAFSGGCWIFERMWSLRCLINDARCVIFLTNMHFFEIYVVLSQVTVTVFYYLHRYLILAKQTFPEDAVPLFEYFF